MIKGIGFVKADAFLTACLDMPPKHRRGACLAYFSVPLIIGGGEAAVGGGVGFKAEHRHRGMKLGIAPYSPDDWGRQLAAGGDEEN